MTTNIIFNIERMNRTNSLRIRHNEKQGKKDDVIKAIEDIDNKIKKLQTNLEFHNLKNKKRATQPLQQARQNLCRYTQQKKRSFR